MAINERLVHTAAEAAGAGSGNQEEGLILHLDANDVDSYDGDGSVWYDITNHEYKPATNVSEHFNTVLYTGDGTDNDSKNITGVGFQPDLVWVKNRDAGSNHYITDSVRGDEKHIYTESTSAENGNSVSVYGGFSIDSDGFTVNRGSNSSSVGTNANGDEYVAWCFKAGGAPSGSDKVSIDGTSYATMTAAELTDGTYPISKLSVNTKLGFSIVKYTARALTQDTIAHGLGETPEMIILKSTNLSRRWNVFHKDVGASKNLHLNTTDAANTDEYWTANSTTFSIQDYGGSADWIAYAFTSKRGVSKVGSYTGTGAAGNKVYTGFEPAFVMVKVSSSTSGWVIIDSKRNDKYLQANTIDTEASLDIVDFNRDGFTFKGSDMNGSNISYIYLAFAKDTNETDLIDDTDLELHLDPASYSGSGTTWTADTGSNATVVASRYDQELGDSFDISTDGESTIQIASGHGLNGTNFTLEFWYKWQSTPSVANRFIYDAGTGWNFFYYAGQGWRINNDDCATGYFSSSEGVTVGKWYHFVITQNSSQNKVYIDGELLKTTSVTSGTRSLAAFDFGTTDITADKPKCDIGQIRTYSSALSQDQVRQNFNFTKNDYPNGFDGTISGATFLPSGVSFDFDGGNDYVKIPATNHSPVDFSKKNYTISCWINPDNNTTLQPIFTKYGASDSLRSIYFNIHSNGTLRLYQRATGTDNTVYSSGTISASTWTHVAVVRDSNTVKFYINGDLDVSRSSTFAPNAGGIQSINIGSQADGNYNFFNGKISDVKIFDRVLTDNEVSEQEAIGYNGIG